MTDNAVSVSNSESKKADDDEDLINVSFSHFDASVNEIQDVLTRVI